MTYVPYSQVGTNATHIKGVEIDDTALIDKALLVYSEDTGSISYDITSYILSSEKGIANGVAVLDTEGKLVTDQFSNLEDLGLISESI
jgi:hypothetical protein